MDILDLLQTWCIRADEIALQHFALDVPAVTKSDGTPVTQADLDIETFLRSAIAQAFPDDAILGEEQGGSLPDSGAAWIIDPIDGTKNFRRGVPIFATLIARWENDALTHGAVSAPGLGSRWLSGDGVAYRDGSPIHVSGVPSVELADVCTGGLRSEWLSPDDRSGLDAVLDRSARHRGLGDFWGYMLVAQGSMDAMIEYAPLKLWDIAAPRAILQAAGGTVTGFDGSVALQEGRCVASNGLIHSELLSLLDR